MAKPVPQPLRLRSCSVTLVTILPGIAFGLVASSLVGQALGRGDLDDAEQWGWDVVRVAILVLGIMGLPMVVLPDLILSGFLHEAETQMAIAPFNLWVQPSQWMQSAWFC